VDNFYWLDQIESEQYLWVGEQALHLSQLARKGYPVIPYFVISALTLREFLATIEWQDPLFADLATSSLRLNVEDAQQLQAIARQIRHMIQEPLLPQAWISDLTTCLNLLPTLASATQAVILRPSIALKSAEAERLTVLSDLTGLLEPQVCWQTANSVATALKQLWTELFRARNLLYLQRMDLSLQDVYLAVVVQPIGSVRASGYLQSQSVHWEVLATGGLPMAIERGEVLPDLYRLDPSRELISSQTQGSQTIAYHIGDVDGSPLERKVWNDSHSYILEQAELQRFLALTQQLKSNFSTPIALEWQLYKDDLYLTHVHQPVSHREEPKPSGASLLEGLSQTPIVSGVGASGGRAIACAKVFTHTDHLPLDLPPETVLVTSEILPDRLPLICQATAIIAEQGGLTSHGAIIARELGIPAVVGADAATAQIQTGDWVLVDGDAGKVYEARTPQQGIPENSAMTSSPSYPPISMTPPIATQLMLALSQPDLAEQAAQYPVDGIGLLRSELMMLTILDQRHPHHWMRHGQHQELRNRLVDQVQKFAQAFAPRPVFYRSMDLRSHEFRSLQGYDGVPEPNPMLGQRGTFSYVLNSELFDLELEALSQAFASGYSNIKLVLPFVRTVEEFVFCRSRIEKAGLAQQAHFQLWIMAEVPSVLFLLPEFVKAGVQGICIGTNDLTQLILGVDRDQSILASTFDETHPAVMAAISQLIQSAQMLNIPCSICGRISTQPKFIDQLIEWGVTSITANLDAIDATYSAITRAEHRLLMKKIRRL
jgi:pyruvate,water dikinase